MQQRSRSSDLKTVSLRRLARGALLGLLLAVLLGGVMGFATAGDGYASGGTVALPAPGPGDRGVYRFSQGVDLQDPGGHSLVRRIAFAFGNDTTYALPGLPSTPLRPIDTAWAPDEEPSDEALDLNESNPDAHVNDLLGFSAVGRHLYGSQGPPLALLESAQRTRDWWIGYFGTPDGGWVFLAESNITTNNTVLTLPTLDRPLSDPVCGLRNPLQGRATGLDGLVVRLDPCELFGRLMPPLAFRPRESATGSEPVTEFVAETAVDGRRASVRFWADADYPVPIQWVLQFQDAPMMEVLALESFEHGGAEYGPPATLAPAAFGARLDMAPRVPSGLDESGIAHPFPASQAWTVALEEDPELAGLVEGGAYVEAALFREETDNETSYAYGEDRVHRNAWFFGVTDGTQRLFVEVEQTRTSPDPGPAAPLAPLVDDPVTDEETHVWVRQNLTYRAFSDYAVHLPGYESSVPLVPTLAPAALPTVEGLYRGWGMGEPAPNGWAFCIPCPQHWRDVQATATVYHDRTEPGDADQNPLAPIWNGETTLRMQWHGPDGRLRGAVEHRTTADPQGTYPLGIHSHEGEDEPVTLASIAGTPALWRLPRALVTAALGLGGLLVALGYWLWPGIKGAAGQALFSRVQAPTALDHPVRDAIYQAVRAEPGIRYAEVAQRLALANGVAQHHVEKLLLTGLLTQRRTPDARFLFATGTADRRTMDARAAALSPELQRVVDDVVAHPATSASDVARRLGLSRQTVASHVSDLAARGALSATRRGRVLELRAAGTAS